MGAVVAGVTAPVPDGFDTVVSDDNAAAQASAAPPPEFDTVVSKDDDDHSSTTPSRPTKMPDGSKYTGQPWQDAILNAYKKPSDNTTLPGIAELAATSVGNVVPAAANAAIDLGSRIAGQGTGNSHLIPEFSPGEAGQKVGRDIATSQVAKTVSGAAGAADKWVGAHLGDTAQDVLHQAGSVAGDIMNIAPAVSLAGTAGRVAKGVADFAGKGLDLDPGIGPPAAQPAPSNVIQLPGSRQSVSAAQTNTGSPFNLTGEETARGEAFPQVKLAKNAGDVPDGEVATRAGIVHEVLNDTGSGAGIRTGVITGNEQTLRSEYQAAKNPGQTEANQVMAAQIAQEQQALPAFAKQRIAATGADPTLNTPYKRGAAMNDGFFGDDGLTAYLRGQKQKIYQQALEKNGATQIATPTTDALFYDPQFNAGLKLAGHQEVASGASELLQLAKTIGFKDPVTGAQYAPGSVAAYNAVTKAINAGWTPGTKRTIAAINAAINGDIALSGGGDLYKLGASIHQLEKSLVSDSPGISKVFGDVDENGVQTAKPFEKVPQTLNDMPLDQWRHIHDTMDLLSRGQIRGAPDGLDPVPKATMQAAARTKAEMEGSLARDVYESGGGNVGEWNANEANTTLNGLTGQKILDVSPPEEIQKWHTLNSAGQIMPGRHPYEGAKAQGVRMEAEPGWLEDHYAPAGAFVSGHLLSGHLGPFAPFVGEKIGGVFTRRAAASRKAAAANNVRAALSRNLDAAGAPATSTATGRASGGRVDHEALASRLFNRWKSAQKDADKTTEPLLGFDDSTIARALKLAQAHPLT